MLQLTLYKPRYPLIACRCNSIRLISKPTCRFTSLPIFHNNPSITRSFPSAFILLNSMSDVEAAKRNAAIRAVADHFDPKAKFIGIGSGSTIVYVVEAIQALKVDTTAIRFVPTGYQSRQVIVRAGLTPIAFDSLPDGILLDVAFDGADEVDDDLNCIKGGGACLYQEKLVATHARKFICVADHRKLQKRLLSNWPTIPIEVEPLALSTVLSSLRSLGSSNPKVREGSSSKTGPVKTDQDNFIIDAPFPPLMLQRDVQTSLSLHHTHKGHTGKGEEGRWEVETLAKEIKMLEGVLSVGIFSGLNGEQAAHAGLKVGGQRPVAAYFGMADGGVVVRNGMGEKVEEISGQKAQDGAREKADFKD